MDTKRVFAPGVSDTTRSAIARYKRAFTRHPHAVMLSPADADKRAESLHLHGLTILRDPSIAPGTVRVLGWVDDGIATT